MEALFRLWIGGMVVTLLFFYIPARFIDWSWLALDKPQWMLKLGSLSENILKWLFGSPAVPFSVRLAQSPVTTLLKGLGRVLGEVAFFVGAFVLVFATLALWPIPWLFLGLMYIRRVLLIRKRLHTGELHV